MYFWTLSIIGSWLLDILALAGIADDEKDHEVLILRHQVNTLERQVNRVGSKNSIYGSSQSSTSHIC